MLLVLSSVRAVLIATCDCDYGLFSATIATFPCGLFSGLLAILSGSNDGITACPVSSPLPPAASLLGRKFARLLLINSLLAARLYYGHIILQYGVWPRKARYA